MLQFLFGNEKENMFVLGIDVVQMICFCHVLELLRQETARASIYEIIKNDTDLSFQLPLSHFYMSRVSS